MRPYFGRTNFPFTYAAGKTADPPACDAASIYKDYSRGMATPNTVAKTLEMFDIDVNKNNYILDLLRIHYHYGLSYYNYGLCFYI